MILGLPSVSADVGGISDLLTHKEEGFLYQSDAPYMLAYYICKIFQNNNIAINLSKKSRLKATKLHNKEQNLEQLLRIYRNVNNDFGNQIFLEERYYDSIS